MPEVAGAGGAAHRAEAEEWFFEHGLPWFVDEVRDDVSRRLSRGRVVAVLAAGVVLGVLVGVVAGLLAGSGPVGFATWVSVVGAVAVVYALWALQARLIAVWALRRTFSSLGLLLPLATRALPMLLLFITFLFINTEVWQVASELQGGILWTAILFFIAAALGFLVPRLAQEITEADGDEPGTELAVLERVNLVTALTIAQAVQVALLSVAVFVFFMVFGAVAIQPEVVETWIGHAPGYPPGPHLVSIELIRVATFLAGFSGLYFTVTAITDEVYRREFFTVILAELQGAVEARAGYRRITASGTPAPPAPGG